MTGSIENYLKGIFLLKKRNKYSNKTLAEYLNISPASVSDMIKKLAKEEYLTINGRDIELTEKGNIIAINIIRKHRVWEVFLVEKLEYNKDEIHNEAEVLEHVTSEKLLKSLEKFLFYPKECPHGSPIYYGDEVDEANIIQLSEAEIGDEIVILNVANNIELYDYLKELKISLKEKYKITKIDPFDGPIYLHSGIDDGEKIIAKKAAELIEVYRKI